MNNEESRLRTFNQWPSGAVVDSVRIAKAGFYYTGQELEVQCFSCGGKISEWNYGDQVMAKHRRLDPHCPFVINPATSGNVPKLMTPSTSLNTSSLPPETTAANSSLPGNFFAQPTNSSTLPSSSDTTDNSYHTESNRLQTFLNWPVPQIVSAQELAKAGFYSLKDGDKVQCAYCNGIAQFWETGDNPKTEHRKHFPQCQFVKSNFNPLQQLVKTPIDGNTKLVSADNLHELGIQAHKGPAMLRYATLESRLRTFAAWPVDLIQTPEMLAEAGFYYVGTGDQVRCFHCDGGLRHWDPDDEPWVEHARWFPACAFVRLIKGQDFIQSCNPQELAHNNLISTITPHTVGRTHLNREISDQEIQTHMNSAPALAALSIGLHMGRVKQAICQKIVQTGTGYTSADALIEAALNLQLDESSDNPTELETDMSQQVSNILSTVLASSNIKPNNDAEVVKLKVVAEARPAAPETLAKVSLEEENRQLKEARLCKICMDNEIGVVFLPCGHLTTCVNCAPSLKDCPVCRSVIKGTVRTFLS